MPSDASTERIKHKVLYFSIKGDIHAVYIKG